MSKSEFIDRVANKGKMSKAEAIPYVERVFGQMERTLNAARKNGKVTIGTLGTFSVSKRGARMGRNPRTGEAIKIKASKSLRFKPAMNLKKAAGC